MIIQLISSKYNVSYTLWTAKIYEKEKLEKYFKSISHLLLKSLAVRSRRLCHKDRGTAAPSWRHKEILRFVIKIYSAPALWNEGSQYSCTLTRRLTVLLHSGIKVYSTPALCHNSLQNSSTLLYGLAVLLHTAVKACSTSEFCYNGLQYCCTLSLRHAVLTVLLHSVTKACRTYSIAALCH